MRKEKKPITSQLIGLKVGEMALFPLTRLTVVSSTITRVQDSQDLRFTTHKNREEKLYEVTRIA